MPAPPISLLTALETVATHPLALVGYVIVVAAWLILGLRVQRNKNLLANLRSLPAHQRLEALQMEMGTVRLEGGFSPEQWIKARNQTYYLIAFGILCLIVVVLFVVARVTAQDRGSVISGIGLSSENVVPKDSVKNPAAMPAASLTSQQGSSAAPAAAEHPASRAASWPSLESSDLTLRYKEVRTGDRVVITPEMPYLKLLRAGGPVPGIGVVPSAFRWEFPRISAKVVNTTPHTIALTAATITVRRSSVVTEPVIVIDDFAANSLSIVNEGWGDVVEPRLQFQVASVEDCRAGRPLTAESNTLDLPRFSDASTTSMLSYIPSALRGVQAVCVTGLLRYRTEDRSERTLRFTTRVMLQMLVGAAMPPSRCYDLLLEAGKPNVVQTLPVQQVINAGEGDNFEFRLATDRSARFDLAITLSPVGGAPLQAGEVSVEVFVPRSQAASALRKAGCGGT